MRQPGRAIARFMRIRVLHVTVNDTKYSSVSIADRDSDAAARLVDWMDRRNHGASRVDSSHRDRVQHFLRTCLQRDVAYLRQRALVQCQHMMGRSGAAKVCGVSGTAYD